MRQQKKIRKQINGWINVDKPSGMTSADVVNRIKRFTNAAKVGHAGTLDPMATGILPIALGGATKTIQYLQEQEKSYRFTVAWGEERDTDDVTGQIVKTSDVRPTAEQITQALPKFTGTIEQVPCTFSAVKIDGQRAYDLARSGEAVELKSRPIDIYDFKLISVNGTESAIFEVSCGKGAYMRALARDLGRKLDCLGHLTAIRRLSVGPFAENTAISLEQIAEIGHTISLDSGLLPLHAALDDIPAYACDLGQARTLRQGQSVVITSPKQFSGPVQSNDLIRVMLGDDFIALGRIQDGYLVPLRVMAH